MVKIIFWDEAGRGSSLFFFDPQNQWREQNFSFLIFGLISITKSLKYEESDSGNNK